MMTEAEQMRIFSKNLNYYIAQSGKQQKEVAKDLGYNYKTFNAWCVGKILPRMGKVQKIADYFKIEKSDLIDDHDSDAPANKPTHRTVINVLGHVAAGIPIEAITDIVDTEEISEQLARCGEYFGLRIKGDSMEPGIKNGDTIIVRQQPDAESGEVVVAIVNGNDGVCKRLRKYGHTLVLESDNHAYEPMSYDPQEVEDIPVRIAGKVVELRRKL